MVRAIGLLLIFFGIGYLFVYSNALHQQVALFLILAGVTVTAVSTLGYAIDRDVAKRQNGGVVPPRSLTLIQRSPLISGMFRWLGIIVMLIFSAILILLLSVKDGTLVLTFTGGYILFPLFIYLGYMLYSMGKR